MNTDIFVPISIVTALAVTVWAIVYNGRKKHESLQKTVRFSVEKGQALPTQFINNLVLNTDPVRADLRRSLLFLSLAVSIVIFALLLPVNEPQITLAIIAFSVFPTIFGLLFLLFWYLGYRRKD